MVLGVRPEHVRPAAPGLPAAAARVELIEPLGQELLVYARAGGQELIARLAPEARVALGATVPLAFDPSGLAFFDAVTRARISADG